MIREVRISAVMRGERDDEEFFVSIKFKTEIIFDIYENFSRICTKTFTFEYSDRDIVCEERMRSIIDEYLKYPKYDIHPPSKHRWYDMDTLIVKIDPGSQIIIDELFKFYKPIRKIAEEILL